MATAPLDTLPRLGGALALDFVNTIDPRYGSDRVDYLPDYEALAAWAAWAKAIAEEDRAGLLAQAERAAPQAAAVHRRALRLRDHLYALLRPARDASAVDGHARAFSVELRRAHAHAQLAVAGDAYAVVLEPAAALDRMLWPVVRSASDLMTSPALARVRECDGTNCGWLFLDTSKAGRRRWCSMEVCGNRAKARRYRASGRRRGAAHSD
ncbi:MAG TPA: CGNR zinc finger domain-containing protein [Solirubrobacteraceae bacterium]|jgi:predicted RNA-binding Zn ribbon-like protein|nr:CGNR zinc finger domain-containing protein [Solirubrobacteraceae bacterium]